MDSGHRYQPRTTATAVAALETSVPGPRRAPAVESASPDITPVDTATVETGPIPVVPAPAPSGTGPAVGGPAVGGPAVIERAGGGGVATAPVVEPVVDPVVDTGPIAVVPAGGTVVVDPPPPTAVTHPCRCGHDRDAHEHFRRGTDCAACGCGRFRKPGLLTRLRG